MKVSMHKFFIFVLFIVLTYITNAEGSCWRYGHSCWGGHGKRSGSLGKAEGGQHPPSKYSFSSQPATPPNSLETDLVQSTEEFLNDDNENVETESEESPPRFQVDNRKERRIFPGLQRMNMEDDEEAQGEERDVDEEPLQPMRRSQRKHQPNLILFKLIRIRRK